MGILCSLGLQVVCPKPCRELSLGEKVGKGFGCWLGEKSLKVFISASSDRSGASFGPFFPLWGGPRRPSGPRRNPVGVDPFPVGMESRFHFL